MSTKFGESKRDAQAKAFAFVGKESGGHVVSALTLVGDEGGLPEQVLMKKAWPGVRVAMVDTNKKFVDEAVKKGIVAATCNVGYLYANEKILRALGAGGGKKFDVVHLDFCGNVGDPATAAAIANGAKLASRFVIVTILAARETDIGQIYKAAIPNVRVGGTEGEIARAGNALMRVRETAPMADVVGVWSYEGKKEEADKSSDKTSPMLVVCIDLQPPPLFWVEKCAGVDVVPVLMKDGKDVDAPLKTQQKTAEQQKTGGSGDVCRRGLHAGPLKVYKSLNGTYKRCSNCDKITLMARTRNISFEEASKLYDSDGKLKGERAALPALKNLRANFFQDGLCVRVGHPEKENRTPGGYCRGCMKTQNDKNRAKASDAKVVENFLRNTRT